MFFGRKLALKERAIKETVDIEELHERANERRIVEGYEKKRKEERKAKIQNVVNTFQGFKRKAESNTKEKRRKEKKIPIKNVVKENKLNKPIGIAGEFKL